MLKGLLRGFKVKIGQYIPGNSIIHSLDPRTKLIITLFFALFILLADNFISLGIICFVLILMIVLTRIKISYIFLPIRFLSWLLIFTLLIYLATSQFYLGVLFTLKLIILVLFVSILSLTTSPLDLCHGLEYLLNPIKKIKIPVQELILIIHLSMRFIPTLFQELDRIIKAHAVRGVDLKSGTYLTRIKRIIPIMVILFKNSFRRADELALALESRGYQMTKNRTKLKKLMMTTKDYSFLILMGIIMVLFKIMEG
jgi:energy-coupling factor transport system permease protein